MGRTKFQTSGEDSFPPDSQSKFRPTVMRITQFQTSGEDSFPPDEAEDELGPIVRKEFQTSGEDSFPPDESL